MHRYSNASCAFFWHGCIWFCDITCYSHVSDMVCIWVELFLLAHETHSQGLGKMLMWCIHKGWKTPTEQNAHGLLAEKHWICERSKVNLPFSLLTPWRYNHTVKLVQQATKLLYCLHNLACQISYVIWKFCHKLLWDMFCHLLRQCLNDHIYFLLCIKKLYETKLLTSAKYCTTSLHVSCFSEQKIKVAINIL